MKGTEKQIPRSARNDNQVVGTPTPMFFVRVANKGLMLDEARKSGRERT
jgi:hypothetical protein